MRYFDTPTLPYIQINKQTDKQMFIVEFRRVAKEEPKKERCMCGKYTDC